MSHFAKVENGIVAQVIVAEQDVIDTGIFGHGWVPHTTLTEAYTLTAAHHCVKTMLAWVTLTMQSVMRLSHHNHFHRGQ